MVSRPELAAPRNKWKPTPTHYREEGRVRWGGKAYAAFVLRLLLSQHQPQKDTSKEGLFDHTPIVSLSETKNGFVLSGVFPK